MHARPPGNDLIWAIISAVQVAMPAFVMMWLTKFAIITGLFFGVAIQQTLIDLGVL